MVISLASSRAHGFKKWSDTHNRTSDPANFVKQSIVVLRNCDADVVPHAVAEQARGPWLVPGVGSSI